MKYLASQTTLFQSVGVSQVRLWLLFGATIPMVKVLATVVRGWHKWDRVLRFDDNYGYRSHHRVASLYRQAVIVSHRLG